MLRADRGTAEARAAAEVRVVFAFTITDNKIVGIDMTRRGWRGRPGHAPIADEPRRHTRAR